MRAFIAHFYCICNGVKHPDCLFVRAVRFVRVALASDGNIVHFWNGDDLRAAFRHIKFFVFFLEIKSHYVTSFL